MIAAGVGFIIGYLIVAFLVIKYIRGDFEPEKPPMPKYRLTPYHNGKYCLEVLSEDADFYLFVRFCEDKDQADKIIANLERGTIYYKEGE